MENVIEILNLKKSFGSNVILRDVSMKLQKGENIAILGKSGTGKSVLTKCIVRLIESDSGIINVLGKDITQMETNQIDEIRKRVGYHTRRRPEKDNLPVF